MADTAPDGLDDIWDDWRAAVNMTPKELEDWLATDDCAIARPTTPSLS